MLLSDKVVALPLYNKPDPSSLFDEVIMTVHCGVD